MATLGQKIKSFRIEKSISQFVMETDLGLGYGSLSRIESGQTYPTRNTLIRFAGYFNLDDRQIDYLIGSRSEIASIEEIQAVINKTSEIWNQPNTFVLLRDDRFRICAATEALMRAFGISIEDWRGKFFLKNIVSLVLDENLDFHNAFNPAVNPFAKEELKSILYAFYHETKSMVLENDYINTVECINANKFAKEIWESILKAQEKEMYLLIKNKHIIFRINNEPLKMAFYTEGIPDSPKFSYIEFFPYPFPNPHTTPHLP